MRQLIVATLLLIAFSLEGFAQNPLQPHYVVVGVFAVEGNAQRFTAEMSKRNYNATYSFNSAKKLYYVHTLYTNDRSEALAMVYNLRMQPDLSKTWIFTGALDDFNQSGTSVSSDVDPSTMSSTTTEAEEIQNPIEESTPVANPNAIASAREKGSASEIEKPLGKPFTFQVTTTANAAPVTGHVVVVESERDTVYQTYNTNEQVYVRPPQNAAGKLVVICQMIGYKYFKKAINFNSVKADESGAITIPIKLVPAQKGDYLELQHVNFYDNSAILKPESQQQLDELVNFMNNPRYKISVHAHTHSDGRTEFVTLGESSDLFALNELNKSHHGSMKELSRHRADVVKKYLVSKGVSSNRISTKGLGGMLAVYEHAHANDRIEVEIVKD